MLIGSYICVPCTNEDRRTTKKSPEELGETADGIGTQRWINSFLVPKQFPKPPAASSQEEYGLLEMEDGAHFAQEFKTNSPWLSIFLIKSKKELGLQVPQKPFGTQELIKLMGVDPTQWLESVIDVSAQITTRMSLSTFSNFFNLEAHERERIYNILSLEYSRTGLAGIVIPPEIYRTLSLADRYWPLNGESAEKCETKHESMRPAVERFVLIGMGGSYTDFHIDFGGSSVWYHVFQGQKIFYVAPPTSRNLQTFEDHKNSDHQTTVFLGDLLENCSRVVIDAGQTLLVPSGWVHAVHTPMDSIVFGGNFLTLQGLEMQIEIQKMDTRRELGDEFGYPSFNTVMFYTALTLSKQLKEHCEQQASGSEGEFPYLSSASALVEYLKEADKEVTSMKKNPSKFARGLTKKEIVEQLEAAVKMAQQKGEVVADSITESGSKGESEKKENNDETKENVDDTEETKENELPDEDQEEDETEKNPENKDEEEEIILEDVEEEKPDDVEEQIFHQNKDDGVDDVMKILRSSQRSTSSANRTRPMKRRNSDGGENERIKRVRTGEAQRSRVSQKKVKDEEERKRRAVEEKKAEMKRKVAEEMNRMEQLRNNPPPTIQGQLDVPRSDKQDDDDYYARMVIEHQALESAAEKKRRASEQAREAERAAIALRKKIEDEEKVVEARAQMTREAIASIEQERRRRNQLMGAHVQAFLAEMAALQAVGNGQVAAAAGIEEVADQRQ